jgi:hypothetical protein
MQNKGICLVVSKKNINLKIEDYEEDIIYSSYDG